MRLILGIMLIGALMGCVRERRAREDARLERVDGERRHPAVVKLDGVADVKTCGCKKTATCGDCCGPEHCRCNPN